MTQYINPRPPMTKENFLATHGIRVDESDLSNFNLDDRSETCIVCLVDNGPFTAAGIMDGERDLRDFTDPSDPRTRSFYQVPTAVINDEFVLGELVQ